MPDTSSLPKTNTVDYIKMGRVLEAIRNFAEFKGTEADYSTIATNAHIGDAAEARRLVALARRLSGKTDIKEIAKDENFAKKQYSKFKAKKDEDEKRSKQEYEEAKERLDESQRSNSKYKWQNIGVWMGRLGVVVGVPAAAFGLGAAAIATIGGLAALGSIATMGLTLASIALGAAAFVVGRRVVKAIWNKLSSFKEGLKTKLNGSKDDLGSNKELKVAKENYKAAQREYFQTLGNELASEYQDELAEFNQYYEIEYVPEAEKAPVPTDEHDKKPDADVHEEEHKEEEVHHKDTEELPDERIETYADAEEFVLENKGLTTEQLETIQKSTVLSDDVKNNIVTYNSAYVSALNAQRAAEKQLENVKTFSDVEKVSNEKTKSYKEFNAALENQKIDDENNNRTANAKSYDNLVDLRKTLFAVVGNTTNKQYNTAAKKIIGKENEIADSIVDGILKSKAKSSDIINAKNYLVNDENINYFKNAITTWIKSPANLCDYNIGQTDAGKPAVISAQFFEKQIADYIAKEYNDGQKTVKAGLKTEVETAKTEVETAHKTLEDAYKDALKKIKDDEIKRKEEEARKRKEEEARKRKEEEEKKKREESKPTTPELNAELAKFMKYNNQSLTADEMNNIDVKVIESHLEKIPGYDKLNKKAKDQLKEDFTQEFEKLLDKYSKYEDISKLSSKTIEELNKDYESGTFNFAFTLKSDEKAKLTYSASIKEIIDQYIKTSNDEYYADNREVVNPKDTLYATKDAWAYAVIEYLASKYGTKDKKPTYKINTEGQIELVEDRNIFGLPESLQNIGEDKLAKLSDYIKVVENHSKGRGKHLFNYDNKIPEELDFAEIENIYHALARTKPLDEMYAKPEVLKEQADILNATAKRSDVINKDNKLSSKNIADIVSELQSLNITKLAKAYAEDKKEPFEITYTEALKTEVVEYKEAAEIIAKEIFPDRNNVSKVKANDYTITVENDDQIRNAAFDLLSKIFKGSDYESQLSALEALYVDKNYIKNADNYSNKAIINLSKDGKFKELIENFKTIYADSATKAMLNEFGYSDKKLDAIFCDTITKRSNLLLENLGKDYKNAIELWKKNSEKSIASRSTSKRGFEKTLENDVETINELLVGVTDDKGNLNTNNRVFDANFDKYKEVEELIADEERKAAEKAAADKKAEETAAKKEKETPVVEEEREML